MRTVVVVADADALAHGFVAPARQRFCSAPVKFRKQRFRRRLRIAMDRNLNWHLITELARLDIDLRDHRAGSDQLASFSCPLRQTRAEGKDAVALRN